MKTNTHIVVLAIAVAAIMGLMAPQGSAATLEIPIKAHATISDGKSETRILVDFGDLSSLAGKKILYAKCYISIDLDSCVDLLNELEVKPLTKPWSPEGVSWSGQWDTPGGDVEEAMTCTVNLETGKNGETEILLTELVQAWVDGRIENHGLTLAPRLKGCGYDLQDDGIGYGKLMVRFVRESP